MQTLRVDSRGARVTVIGAASLCAALAAYPAVLAFAPPPASLLYSLLLGPAGYWHWIFLHEVLHGHGLSNHRANRWLGRILGVFFGAPYAFLQYGHLLHHRFSRQRDDRPDLIEGRAPTTGERLLYLSRAAGGLYAAEIIAGAIALLPRSLIQGLADRLGADNQFLRILGTDYLKRLTEIRFDALLALGFFALLFLAAGNLWYSVVFVVAMRGFLVSMMDNVYHFATPRDRTAFARNLRLSGWLSRALFHANLHGVHHRYPNLTWDQLPAQFIADGARSHGRLGRLFWMQLRGPLRVPVKRSAVHG